jgi:hypothetical protein
MSNKRLAWVVESRTAGIRPGAWSAWKPWLMHKTRKEAAARLKTLNAAHAECCPPGGFRIRKYVPAQEG